MKYSKIIREIDRLIKKDLTSLAMNLAERHNLFYKEIESYIKFYELYGKNIGDAIDKVTPKKEISRKITNEIHPESNRDLFRLMYNIKDEEDYSRINEIANNENLVSMKPFFENSLFRTHSKN